jgi:Flp pilus assembly pilin Flp
MKNALNRFHKDQSGAVTVDWVVLTAALVGLGMIVLIPIAFSTNSSAQGVADYISNINSGFENN